MISADLDAIRKNVAKLQLGQMTPELFGQLFPELGNVDDLQEELQPALDDLIRELLAMVNQGTDEEENEQAVHLMLRELGTTAYLAGRLSRDAPESGLTIEITPEAAVELVKSLLQGHQFSFSFKVEE